MVRRWAHINKDNIVENISLWDGDKLKWQPPEDHLMIEAPDHISIGWTYDGTDFVEPVRPEVTPEVPPTE